MAMDKTLLVSLSLVLYISSSFSQYGKVGADLNPNERQALLTLRATVGGRSQLWNTTNNPCTWPGVFCSKKQDTVVELHLPGMGLFGQLPLGLGNLTNLQTLSLRFNALSGSVPPDLANLNGSLRNLYLQGNSFSGEVPGFLFGMQNLVRLNLARNNFSGKMSKDFKNLVRLGTLYLEENQLTGSIPDVDSLAGLDQFNVSYNKLTGRIPKQVDHFPKSSFEGNSLCGGPLVACKKKKLSGGAIAGIIIGCIIGLLLILMVLLLLLLCVRRRRKKKGEEGKTRNVEAQSKEVGDVEIPREKVVPAVAGGSGGNAGGLGTTVGKSGGANSLVFFGDIAGRKFDLEDLLRASAEVLGKGTFGTAYKATLDAGVVVAVKRLKDVAVPEKELREKMEVVGRMNHENLVALRAYYYSRDEKLLVYDYMPMGSLSALLHGNRGAGRTPLNWETRSSIALGATRGIAYIHSQGSASHGNIKSSNILLTTSYEARVSDFGLAHLAVPTPTPNRVDGYRAPEVTDPRKVSQKADVYSFGVFLLELLTGKPPTHSLNNDEGVDLPRWVQSVVREEWSAEVFDPELLRYQTVEEDMVQLLELAVDCTAQYPDSRPTMAEVRTRMEDICCPISRQEEAGGDHDGHEIIDDGGSQHAYSVGSGAPPP